jgi:hypothetical protein
MEQKLFSKIKKQIENLFEPGLKMQFCCIAYPMRTQWANNHIPRFYIKLDDKIIWDFPKDFPEVKQLHWAYWCRSNGIIDLVREYIDTPVGRLLQKKFKGDTQYFTAQYLWQNTQETCKADYKLTDIFKAADRRLGKEKLLEWAAKIKNPIVDRILDVRFKTVLRLVEVPVIGYRLNDIAHIRSIEFRSDCIYFNMTLLGVRLLKHRPNFVLNKDTYIWISETNTKLPLIKCAGLPPTYKVTKKNGVLFQLYFPLPENWEQLDFVHLIEDENDSATCINQYMISLTGKTKFFYNLIKSKNEIPDI